MKGNKRTFSFHEASSLKGRYFKSVNSKGEAVAVICVDETEIGSDYVVAIGSMIQKERSAIEMHGKLNIAVRMPSELKGVCRLDDERHYVLHDAISEISEMESRLIVNRFMDLLIKKSPLMKKEEKVMTGAEIEKLNGHFFTCHGKGGRFGIMCIKEIHFDDIRFDNTVMVRRSAIFEDSFTFNSDAWEVFGVLDCEDTARIANGEEIPVAERKYVIDSDFVEVSREEAIDFKKLIMGYVDTLY